MAEQGTSSPRRSILIVHGRGFKPAAESLMDISLSAIRAGLQRDYPDCVSVFDSLQVELAYYGDLTNELLLGHGRHYDESIDVGDRQFALAALREIPTRKRFGIRQYDRLPGKSAFGEFVADIFVPVLSVFGLWMWACSRKASDFAAYLERSPDYASAVRERIRNKLAELLAQGDRILLISHGIGSAITWDVLWELSHDERYTGLVDGAKVDTWLTMGSPLGDGQVRRRLRGALETGVRRFPTNVVAWHNVSAEDDYVCHDKTLGDDFRKMMGEHVISAVNDYKIYNHAVRFGRSNPHSSVGYYIHPRTSKIIADWLLADKKLTISPRTPE